MLIKQKHLEGIREGRIRYAFRKWNKPAAKAGSSLRTSVGVLSVDAVKATDVPSISEKDALLAGFPSRNELLKELNKRPGDVVFRITLRYAGPDPREALRENDQLTEEETTGILRRLKTLDARSKQDNWTLRTLQAISQDPNNPAGVLSEKLGFEKEWLKIHIRKLKELGLTESLSPGYRLSPRGRKVLEYCDTRPHASED